MSKMLEQLESTVIDGRGPVVRDETAAALEEGISAADILEKALMPAMDEVGRRMATKEFYIPDVLIAARTMGMALEVLKPHLTAGGAAQPGTAVIGTVKGDLHDIGKNLVGMMLQGANFNVVDLGTDVSGEQFVAAIREHEANLIGMSALLTTTMVEMKDTVDAVKEAGLRDQVRIMVGGAPVTQRYADEVGADGYAPDAGSAVVVARELLAV
jgi:5-methyltetrahydrofolate--homocysteine methyltransferase